MRHAGIKTQRKTRKEEKKTGGLSCSSFYAWNALFLCASRNLVCIVLATHDTSIFTLHILHTHTHTHTHRPTYLCTSVLLCCILYSILGQMVPRLRLLYCTKLDSWLSLNPVTGCQQPAACTVTRSGTILTPRNTKRTTNRTDLLLVLKFV